MRQEEVEVAVVVGIARVDAHARFGNAVAIECQAGEECTVAQFERVGCVAQPELVGGAVVGQVQVDSRLAVEFGDEDAECGSGRCGHAAAAGDVAEAHAIG